MVNELKTDEKRLWIYVRLNHCLKLPGRFPHASDALRSEPEGRSNNFMADEFFIEKRPGKGDYAIRKPGSGRASGTAPTQEAAIEAAKEMNSNATIFAERQRHTTGGDPDKWRVVYKPSRD